MSHSIYQWLSLVGIIWLQSFNGTNTDFPAYSSQLKNLFSISQFQLNNLAFASDAGKLLGWFSGVAANYLPIWVVLILGATLGLIGYGIQFLYVVQKIWHLSYFEIFMLNALAGNSICWINTVCYTSIIKNFPFDPQVAVGLSTSYVGLSAKIYTDIVDVISPSGDSTAKAKNYLLLNSILPLFVAFVTVPMLLKDVASNKVSKADIAVQSGFTIMFFVTIVTGIYSIIGSLGWNKVVESPWLYAIGLALLLIVIPLMIPLGLMVGKFLLNWWHAKRDNKICHLISMDDNHLSANSLDKSNRKVVVEMNKLTEVVAQDSTSISNDDSIGSSTSSSSREEIGVKMMLKRMEFWLYFFVYMFGATLGLVFMNNLGQIAESRGQSAATTSSLVSLSSAFSFFGRLLPSLLHHFSRNKYMISTTRSIATLMAPISAAFYLLAFNSGIVSLYISTVIIGLCIGSFTSISVSATTELFGTKNFSINHNIIVGNIPIGSFVFGTCAALLYEKKKKSEHTNMTNICMGAACYRTTFIIWGCISLLGTILAFVLYLRTRKFYQQKQLS